MPARRLLCLVAVSAKTLRHEMFGSSDEAEYSSRVSKRLSSHSYDAKSKHDDVTHHDDADDTSRSHRSRNSTSYCGDRSASTYVGTTQEDQDIIALL